MRAFLNTVDASVPGWFSSDEAVHVARAPGRLDLMGGFADYSGSLVLQWPLAEAAIAAVQPRDDAELHVFSPCADGSRSEHVALRLSDLGLPGQPIEYARLRDAYAAVPRDRWGAYLLGAVLVLARERGARLDHGLALLLQSDVPEGAGIASSAAIEVAGMQAIAAMLGLELDGRELALLAQKVENEIAGAPCGVMDQMTAACGEAGKLLALRCQPCELEGQVGLPEEIEVLGLHTGVRHAVSGSDYASVRLGAFAGYRILAELRGLPVRPDGGVVAIDDPEWRGHLANCDPDEFAARWAGRLPETIGGRELLTRYRGLTDGASRIDPDRTYAVRAPTVHPVEENARAARFRALLGGPVTDQTLADLGDLMFASHASYTACGLGEDTADWIVEQVRAGRARNNGLFGARITGGGMGGTVAILGRRGKAWLETLRIKRDLGARIGRTPDLFRWSSDGAQAFGTVRLDPRGA